MCGAFGAQAFEVFQDPTNSGSNPSTPAPVPTNGSSVPVNVWVEHSGTYLGWDIEVRATGGMEFVSFSPNDPNQVIYSTNATTLRANRVEPDTGMSGAVRVGTLTLRSTGNGNANIIGHDYINSAVATVSVPTGTLASTTVCDPTANSDGEGLNDCDDNCPFVSNLDQKDSGGIGFASPDGIGDACQCGDVTGDGKVNSFDSTMITRNALSLAAPLFKKPDNCDVTGDGLCNSFDATIIKRAAVGLPPGVQQVCPNAIP